MLAVYIAEFADTLSLEVREIPEPPPVADNQTLILVRAAGLNRADLLQARGVYPPPKGCSPNVPGLEFAGEVTKIGPNVRNYSPGDRVFGIAAGEAQAELIVSDESLLTRIPDNLTFNQAAAIPEAFITAHDALFTLGELKDGETVLVHAVGSGVGLAALQLAKANGNFVIGTARTAEKVVRCEQEYGLDNGLVIRDAKHFAESVKSFTEKNGVDLVLDLVGAAYFSENLESLALKGRLILVGLTSGATTEFNLGVALRKRARILGTTLRSRPIAEKADATLKFAGAVVPLLASGQIVPNVDRVFSLDDVIAAYKYLESNESFGKVVLEF